MFELEFGIIFTLCSAIFFYVSISFGEINIFAALLMLLFLWIGIKITVIGIKEILRNINTEKNGEECFGKVINIEDTGARSNGRELYKASVAVYIGTENRTEFVSEKIGFNSMLYKVGSYVKVKYYLGDINFICSIYDSNDIPENVIEIINKDLDNYLNNDDNKIENEKNDNNIKENSEIESPEVQAKVEKVAGVVIIIFAIFWLLFMLIFTRVFNVADNEVSTTLMFKIIIGIFWIIGIIMMITGIKLCLTKVPTNEEKTS